MADTATCFPPDPQKEELLVIDLQHVKCSLSWLPTVRSAPSANLSEASLPMACLPAQGVPFAGRNGLRFPPVRLSRGPQLASRSHDFACRPCCSLHRRGLQCQVLSRKACLWLMWEVLLGLHKSISFVREVIGSMFRELQYSYVMQLRLRMSLQTAHLLLKRL